MALLLCLVSCCGAAEETRRGNYIYVPRVAAEAGTGTTVLHVGGTALGRDGEKREIENLPGAVFGVYVFSGEGELTPWADPLYPFEPMRLRTGDAPLSFSLPSGIDFYLRQEAAPEGFVFDAETLIPVTQGELTVINEAEGELRLLAQDTQGKPLSGVEFSVWNGGERIASVVTDGAGAAAVPVKAEMRLTLLEEHLPEGVHPALYVLEGDEMISAEQVAVDVRPAERVTAEWVHPSEGTVELKMSASSVGEDGESERRPLPGVTMEIADTGVRLTTDDSGSASLSILEGSYLVRFAYEGDGNVSLPLEEGQMIVEGGSLTLIELEASERTGRVAVATGREGLEGGFSLKEEETGAVFGPYAFDEEGRAVSALLGEGQYELELSLPESALLRGFAADAVRADETGRAVVTVTAGELAEIPADVSLLSSQRYALAARRISESGDYREEPVSESLTLTLYGEAGDTLGQFRAESGELQLGVPDGVYRLGMEKEWAAELGVLDVSEPFSHPDENGTVVFKCETGRLILQAKDAEGAALPGAVYSVTDGAGNVQTAECDGSGTAVTGPLAPGTVSVETVTAPVGCAEGGVWTAELEAGAAAEWSLVHEKLGRETVLARLKGLDDAGNTVLTPLAGAVIRISHAAGAEEGETAAVLTADADGSVTLPLPAGDYVASLQDSGGVPVASTGVLAFTAENDKQETGTLLAADTLGGVRVRYGDGSLTDAQLAQARFRVTAPDGGETELVRSGDAFTAFGLAAGEYTLTQIQTPVGQEPAKARELHVEGGEVCEAAIPLVEYARLSVSKVGLTFNTSLQTFVVPLEGEYAVYQSEDGILVPYPDAENQARLFANVSGDEADRPAEILLPAQAEGTSYFLQEIGGASGFVVDETAHEVVLHAGETARPEFSVASDRGFFTADAVDTATGAHLSGGEYALIDGEGNSVLTFTMGEAPYRTETAIPVGLYTLRQLTAPEGYALAEEAEQTLELRAYLSGMDEENRLLVRCRRIPAADETVGVDAELWMAEEQGLTLIGIDCSGGAAVALARPQVVIETQANGRTDIESLTLSGAADESGRSYRARVEFALRNGGWQPSRAKLTDALETPTTVSFAEIEGDITALRITYLDAETGAETAEEGFVPGEAVVSVRAEGDAQAEVLVHASVEGTFCYRTAWNGERLENRLTRAAEETFVLPGNGTFGTESGGRDGTVSGYAFLDTDGDGVLDAEETGRCAGLTVSLLDEGGNAVDTVRTATDGRYAFGGIPTGNYRIRFDAGDVMVYSHDGRFTEHASSRVTDARRGTTDLFAIDGEHTDYLLLAGCLYAGSIQGFVADEEADGTTEGMGGISVELIRLDREEDEPTLVSTDDTGAFAFTGLIPGAYRLEIRKPDGYLAKADKDELTQEMTLEQGGQQTAGEVVLVRSAAVSGSIWLDEEGNGLPGAEVTLLRLAGGTAIPEGTVTTGTDGRFAFDTLYPDEYSIQVTLPDAFGFAPYGEHSAVFGAAGHTGSTQPFTLGAGQNETGLSVGATVPAQLEVSVFRDAQADGLMQPNEKGLSGVSVVLVRREEGEDGERLALTTDEEGRALFTSLTPGVFVLSYEMPGQWRPSGVKAGSGGRYPESILPQSTARAGRSAEFSLSSGEQRELYIAAAMTGTVSGTVYEDGNANARRETDEKGMGSLPVRLLTQDGETAAETVTQEDGSYSFEGLPAGRYAVSFTVPEDCGFAATQRSLVANGAQGTTQSVSETRLFTLSQGAAVTEVNAPAVRLASVGGRIWEDLDADGRMADGERALSGVKVELLGANGRTAAQSAETDADGRYAFTRLTPGTYQLRVRLLDGHVLHTGEETRAAVREMRGGYGYTDLFTLAAGEAQSSFDYGMLVQGALSGRVWNDENYDGTADRDESGLRGLTLTLLDEQGNALEMERTGRSGEFSFTDLMPGVYQLKVTLDDGYVFTAAGKDSMAERSDEREQVLTLPALAMGETRNGLLIGALKPAALGGVVWYDANDDGRRQTGETVLKDIPVRLQVVSGTDAGKGMEALTGEDGAYRFDGVMPGEVRVSFALPEGYAFARSAQGRTRVSIVPQTDAGTAESGVLAVGAGSLQTDLDAGAVGVGIVSGQVFDDRNYNGQRDADEAGVAEIDVSLTDAAGENVLRTVKTAADGSYAIDFVRTGEYRVRITLPEDRLFTCGGTVFPETDERTQQTEPFALAMGEGRTGLDAGIIRPAEVSGTLQLTAPEEAETRLAGVTVALYDGGTLLRTCTADDSGSFALHALRPGTYRLRITLPEDLLFAEDAWLLPADPNAQESETLPFETRTGESVGVRPIPVVCAALVTGRTWSDENADGRMDADEPPLSGVRVSLLDESGAALAETLTGESGVYSFGRLRAGRYAVRFTLPEGQLFADRTGEADGSCVVPAEGGESQTEFFTLQAGQRIAGMNVGAILPGEIGDTVWLDSNGNGLQDYREQTLPDIRLTLIKEADGGGAEQTFEAVSDFYGYYHFRNLRPGDYRLKLESGNAYGATLRFGPGLDEIDSDIDPDTGYSDVIHLNSGERLLRVDVGLVKR